MCLSRDEFAEAFALLPVAVTPEEDWVRAVCLHVLNRVKEIPDAGVLYTTPARHLFCMRHSSLRTPVLSNRTCRACTVGASGQIGRQG